VGSTVGIAELGYSGRPHPDRICRCLVPDSFGMSDSVRLRDVEEADLEVFLEQEHDPEAVRRSKFQPRQREAFMTHWVTNILGDPTVLVQAVIVDGETAGSIVSWWEQQRRFIGYWFGRPYWGRGIGTKALTLFLQKEKTRPLYADPYTGNTGSVRLLEKCGFQRTGTIEHDQNEHILFTLSGDQGDLSAR
jgi:RimJ/RimL family protein N-acetyltransferase